MSHFSREEILAESTIFTGCGKRKLFVRRVRRSTTRLGKYLIFEMDPKMVKREKENERGRERERERAIETRRDRERQRDKHRNEERRREKNREEARRREQ